jgi:hypothetical protein
VAIVLQLDRGMFRLPLMVTAVLAAACGTDPDNRPVTFEVVTLEVMQPTCGQVQCHSTTTWTEGLAFDTLDAASVSFKSISAGELKDVILGQEDRMPPDLPMAEQDQQLLFKWLDAGKPGL